MDIWNTGYLAGKMKIWSIRYLPGEEEYGLTD
jgi:hypothetical protein